MTDLFTDNASFDAPLDVLHACHGRIRRQLGTLERLARHLPVAGSDADARAAARAILKYFDGAAPNHHADEEQSLFPRLVAAASSPAAALVDTLARQHEELAAMWLRLRPDLAAVAAGARSVLTPALVRRVRAAYFDHIDREETELLPLAAERLDAATLATIGAEMAHRRGLPYPAPSDGPSSSGRAVSS
jgi:pyridoxamine 5'-phosphate oxidase